MGSELIKYVDGKAVKITENMRGDLNKYNQRRTEIASLTDVLNIKKREIEENNAQIAALQEQINGDDRKQAKEANKQAKSLQKEIDKANKEISDIQANVDKMLEKQNKGLVAGTSLKDFELNRENSLTNELDEFTEETPAQFDETTQFEPLSAEIPSEENALAEESSDMLSEMEDEPKEYENDMLSEMEDTPDMEPMMEETNLDETPSEEIAPEELPVEETSLEEELPSEEMVTEENSLEEMPVEESEETSEEQEETNFEMPEVSIPETPVYETQGDAIWAGLQNLANEEPTELEAENVIPEVSEETIPEINEEPETTEDELKAEVHNDIENSLPSYEPMEAVDTENTMNSVYQENEIMPEEPAEKRDLTNLTLFTDYRDYTFEFAREHYQKDAFSIEELDALSEIKEYLTEKSFYSKRSTQINRIDNENKKLKTKVADLGKDFSKKLKEISEEYSINIKELTETTAAAKEQAEIDRVEKVQTQKLNDELTKNSKEQTETIEKLNNNVGELQSTIDSQNEKIEELEKLNSEQADRIKSFEDKLNAMFGIFKED